MNTQQLIDLAKNQVIIGSRLKFTCAALLLLAGCAQQITVTSTTPSTARPITVTSTTPTTASESIDGWVKDNRPDWMGFIVRNGQLTTVTVRSTDESISQPVPYRYPVMAFFTQLHTTATTFAANGFAPGAQDQIIHWTLPNGQIQAVRFTPGTSTAFNLLVASWQHDLDQINAGPHATAEANLRAEVHDIYEIDRRSATQAAIDSIGDASCYTDPPGAFCPVPQTPNPSNAPK